MLGTWPGLAQITEQNVARFIAQRQPQHLFGLGLPDAKNTLTPVDVIELQLDQFPPAQTVSGSQIQQREIPHPVRMGLIDGEQKRLHLLAAQRSRQTLHPIDTRRIDLLVQRPGQCSLGKFKAQEEPQRRDDLLQTRAVIGSCGLAKKVLDLLHAQAPQCGRLLVKLQEAQQISDPAPAGDDRCLGQTAHLAHMQNEALQFELRGRWRHRLGIGNHSPFAQERAKSPCCTAGAGLASAEMNVCRGQSFRSYLRERTHALLF